MRWVGGVLDDGVGALRNHPQGLVLLRGARPDRNLLPSGDLQDFGQTGDRHVDGLSFGVPGRESRLVSHLGGLGHGGRRGPRRLLIAVVPDDVDVVGICDRSQFGVFDLAFGDVPGPVHEPGALGRPVSGGD